MTCLGGPLSCDRCAVERARRALKKDGRGVAWGIKRQRELVPGCEPHVPLASPSSPHLRGRVLGKGHGALSRGPERPDARGGCGVCPADVSRGRDAAACPGLRPRDRGATSAPQSATTTTRPPPRAGRGLRALATLRCVVRRGEMCTISAHALGGDPVHQHANPDTPPPPPNRGDWRRTQGA